MCIGAPMQVIVNEGTQAWCEADGQGQWLDMQLPGPQTVGSWVHLMKNRELVSGQKKNL